MDSDELWIASEFYLVALLPNSYMKEKDFQGHWVVSHKSVDLEDCVLISQHNVCVYFIIMNVHKGIFICNSHVIIGLVNYSLALID